MRAISESLAAKGSTMFISYSLTGPASVGFDAEQEEYSGFLAAFYKRILDIQELKTPFT